MYNKTSFFHFTRLQPAQTIRLLAGSDCGQATAAIFFIVLLWEVFCQVFVPKI